VQTYTAIIGSGFVGMTAASSLATQGRFRPEANTLHCL